MKFFLKNRGRLIVLALTTLFALTVSAAAVAALNPRGIFIEPTFGYMNLDMPNFTYGSFDGESGNAINYDTSTAHVVPGVNLGANFNNNLFPSLFGTTATLEATFQHLRAHTNESAEVLPPAFFGNIDGSGLIVPFRDFVTMDQRTMIAEAVSFRAENDMDLITLKYTGHKEQGIYGAQKLTNEPFVAIFYRYLKQDDSLSSDLFNTPDGSKSSTPIPFPMALNENVKTNYYGVQLGDRWVTQWNSQIYSFLEGSVSIGGMHAVLNGNQMLQLPANFLPQTSVNGAVNNSENNWDCEIGLAAEAQWSPPTTLPIRFTLRGGANWISTVPKIVNPVDASQVAHLDNVSAINPYIEGRVSFTLPF